MNGAAFDSNAPQALQHAKKPGFCRAFSTGGAPDKDPVQRSVLPLPFYVTVGSAAVAVGNGETVTVTVGVGVGVGTGVTVTVGEGVAVTLGAVVVLQPASISNRVSAAAVTNHFPFITFSSC